MLSFVLNTLCYMDVELVHATTHDEHLNGLEKVFRAQEGVGVKRNNVKCQYLKNV